MSLERIQEDPYDMINSDDPEKVEGGLIFLRALAITGGAEHGVRPYLGLGCN
jgi:hypothetical protein